MERMTREEALELLRMSRTDDWNRAKAAGALPADVLDASQLPDRIGLENVNAVGADFSSLTINRVNFTGATLSKANFVRSTIVDCGFGKVTAVNANFVESTLKKVYFSSARLARSRMTSVGAYRCSFTRANVAGMQLHGLFERCTFGQVDWSGVTIHGEWLRCTFNFGKMSEAMLHGVNLTGSRFRLTDLRGAHLTQCNLSGVDLRSALLSDQTRFDASNVDDCLIDRETLRFLRNLGGLASSDLRKMRIVGNDVVRLRSAFSGYRRWIHLGSVVVFVAPYIYFLARIYPSSAFVDASRDTVSVVEALCRFIHNGGRNWEAGWDIRVWPLSLFFMQLAYNLVRLVLVWKVATLDLQERVRGFHDDFRLEKSWWGRIFKVAQVGFYLNLVWAFLHMLYFLGQRVPVGS